MLQSHFGVIHKQTCDSPKDLQGRANLKDLSSTCHLLEVPEIPISNCNMKYTVLTDVLTY